MRKFLTGLAVAVAILASGAVNEAKAQGAEGSPALPVSAGAGIAMFVGTTLGMAYLVYDHIKHGGLSGQYVEVVPGAGYQSRDYATAAKLTHEFNVAMGYADDVQTAKYLAAVR